MRTNEKLPMYHAFLSQVIVYDYKLCHITTNYIYVTDYDILEL